MKKIFYFLFLSLFFSSLASATFSPSPDKGFLNFTLQPDVEQCQLVTVSSEDYLGEISIRDIWAETFDGPRDFDLYTKRASDHDLSISYIDNIADFENQITIEVCISGNTPGDYRGALIFTPETQANESSVVEIGTWLLVHIDGQVVPDSPNNPSSSEGGSSGGKDKITQPAQTIQLQVEKVFENLNDKSENNSNPDLNNQQENSDVGNIVKNSLSSPKNLLIIGVALILISLLVTLALRKTKNE